MAVVALCYLGTFSLAYTAPSGDFPNKLAIDTTRNQIIVGLQVSPNFVQLVSGGGGVAGTLTAPGTIPYQMYASNDPDLAYDAVNDVLWGLTEIFGGSGLITGIHVGSNTIWGYCEISTQPELGIDGIFYGMNVPAPGQPPAVYVTGQTSPDLTFGLFKIQLCHFKRGSPPDH